MNFFIYLLILFMIISCNPRKYSYWCGDHPCINKKEKEEYFKKNMTVEMKSTKNINYKNNSEIEKIMQEAQEAEIIRIRNKKNLSKNVKLQEKKLIKQIRLEEKKLIKDEKKLAKQIKLKEKKQIKDEKKLAIKKNNVSKEKQLKKKEINLSKFSELVEKITRKNAFKSYPDINDTPN